MAEFLSEHPIYTVLLIALICWIGIFLYLMQLDRRITRLEQALPGAKEKS